MDEQTPNTLDDLVNDSYLQDQRDEAAAVAIEQRLRISLSDLPYSSQWFSQQRAMGTARNPYAGKHANMSIRAHVERRDPQLANWLAKSAGVGLPAPDYAAQEKEAQRQAAAERMIAETEILRQRNLETRAMHDAARHANLPNKPGSRGEFRIQ